MFIGKILRDCRGVFVGFVEFNLKKRLKIWIVGYKICIFAPSFTKKNYMELTLADRLYFSAQEKSHPEFIRNEYNRIARERCYFANLRNEVYKRAVPSYVILKDGSLQAFNPKHVVDAIHEIDEMERLHFLGDRFAMYVEECKRERDNQYKESFT